MCGLLEHLGGWAVLDDSASVHDGDPVGDSCHNPEVVRDEDDGHAELFLETHEELEDLGLHRDIERVRSSARRR
jgi:hypothetical protein